MKMKIYSRKAVYAFFITAVIAFILNYMGSLLFFDELLLSWPFILIVGLLVAICVYLRAYISTLEERIQDLEQQLRTKK